MLVDVEIRERLSHFCLVKKLTQEKAANKGKRTGCTVLTETTLGVYGRLGTWMRRED